GGTLRKNTYLTKRPLAISDHDREPVRDLLGRIKPEIEQWNRFRISTNKTTLGFPSRPAEIPCGRLRPSLVCASCFCRRHPLPPNRRRPRISKIRYREPQPNKTVPKFPSRSTFSRGPPI